MSHSTPMSKARRERRTAEFAVRDALIVTLALVQDLGIREIAQAFEITHQRVSQVLRAYGVNNRERQKARTQAREDLAHAVVLERQRATYCGLTRQEFKKLMNNGKGLSAQGSYWRAFKQCRANSLYRGFPWTLSFPEWVETWNKAGGWAEGSDRKRPVVLGRKNKRGGYTQGNVAVVDWVKLMENRTGYFERKAA